MRHFWLAALLSIATQEVQSGQSKDSETDAAIRCYHYDPHHPYLDDTGPSLFSFVSVFFQRGQIDGSFFVASNKTHHAKCEAHCNSAIPAGHRLLRMRAYVNGHEYPISFRDSYLNEDFEFKRIVVFGDSLSDEGRVVKALQKLRGDTIGKLLRGGLRILGCALPRHFLGFGLEPYWNGVLSNGPGWPSHLSEMLRKMAVDNYAFGGATIGRRPCHDIHLLSILKRFLHANKNSQSFSDNLFLIWLGANNYFDSRTKTIKPVDLNVDVASTLADLSQGIELLCKRGARNIVLFTIPNPAQSPEWIFDANPIKGNTMQAQKPRWRKAVSLHNSKLREQYASMAPDNKCSVTLFDVDAILQKYQQHLDQTPIKYLMQSNPRFDPEQFIQAIGYFDPVHPTTRVHCLLAAELVNHLKALGLVSVPDFDHDNVCTRLVARIAKPSSTNTGNEEL